MLGQSVTQLNPTANDVESPSEDGGKPPSAATSTTLNHGQEFSQASRFLFPAMSHANLNPPEVQCYVVEHIVKNDDSAIHSTQRLRAFSGRLPRPQNESDYEIWRSGIELLLQDPAVSDLQRSRKIFDSLSPPAADVVKHLRPDTPQCIYRQEDGQTIKEPVFCSKSQLLLSLW
ncbi:Paraneoplastic antigen Ma1 37 kDa neuronal protein Neuron- and testis-specific protein 1 [Larimichthys crocea]|uniref:Paraneoplastic antigen Ma1 37 kDa neuronal protein Neuron-and testis-specific protein 1 n=1 Tax=Larimichthys crocea TaxID=215358 RepID=A0A6G0J7W5_LARCR|nr:Paraneoplastic antigen Ma1 37 kDa neuronal protein Neuron- and testis-specific protein 1 [Larimichthys crocea]